MSESQWKLDVFEEQCKLALSSFQKLLNSLCKTENLHKNTSELLEIQYIKLISQTRKKYRTSLNHDTQRVLEHYISEFKKVHSEYMENCRSHITKLQKGICSIIDRKRIQYSNVMENVLASHPQGLDSNDLKKRHEDEMLLLKDQLIMELQTTVGHSEPYRPHMICLSHHIEKYFLCVLETNERFLRTLGVAPKIQAASDNEKTQESITSSKNQKGAETRKTKAEQQQISSKTVKHYNVDARKEKRKTAAIATYSSNETSTINNASCSTYVTTNRSPMPVFQLVLDEKRPDNSFINVTLEKLPRYVTEPNSTVYINIDLNNIAVGYLRNNELILMENEFGDTYTQTTLAQTFDNRFLYGPKTYKTTNFRNKWSMKTFFTPKTNSFDTVIVSTNRIKITGEIVLGFLLKKLKLTCQSRINAECGKAVVSIPNWFENKHRLLVYDAAIAAGFTSVELHNQLSVFTYAYLYDNFMNQQLVAANHNHILIIQEYEEFIYSCLYFVDNDLQILELIGNCLKNFNKRTILPSIKSESKTGRVNKKIQKIYNYNSSILEDFCKKNNTFKNRNEKHEFDAVFAFTLTDSDSLAIIQKIIPQAIQGSNIIYYILSGLQLVTTLNEKLKPQFQDNKSQHLNFSEYLNFRTRRNGVQTITDSITKNIERLETSV